MIEEFPKNGAGNRTIDVFVQVELRPNLDTCSDCGLRVDVDEPRASEAGMVEGVDQALKMSAIALNFPLEEKTSNLVGAVE